MILLQRASLTPVSVEHTQHHLHLHMFIHNYVTFLPTNRWLIHLLLIIIIIIIICTTEADSYVTSANQSATSVAEHSVDWKCQKYGELTAALSFSHWQSRHMSWWHYGLFSFWPPTQNIHETQLMVISYFNKLVCWWNALTRSYSTRLFQLQNADEINS